MLTLALLLAAAPAGPVVKTIHLANNHPKVWQGKCPTKLIFTADLALSRPGAVKYQWSRSDGGIDAEESINAAKGGGHAVHYQWELGQSFKGWLKFEDLTDHKYQFIHFEVKCK